VNWRSLNPYSCNDLESYSFPFPVAIRGTHDRDAQAAKHCWSFSLIDHQLYSLRYSLSIISTSHIWRHCTHRDYSVTTIAWPNFFNWVIIGNFGGFQEISNGVKFLEAFNPSLLPFLGSKLPGARVGTSWKTQGINPGLPIPHYGQTLSWVFHGSWGFFPKGFLPGQNFGD